MHLQLARAALCTPRIVAACLATDRMVHASQYHGFNLNDPKSKSSKPYLRNNANGTTKSQFLTSSPFAVVGISDKAQLIAVA